MPARKSPPKLHDIDSHELPGSGWKQPFRRRLLTWYRIHRRDLPWRRSQDPYRVWISEIMLQQTQVATVEGYFARFLQHFPDVQTLADATEADVLRQWEGLGYYRRARQMHRAAKVIVSEHGGVFPEDPQVILSLPGIGRYTAGAIASIAFDAREPIVEANTIRLYCRLLKYADDPTKSEGQRLLWAFATAVLPRRGSGELNQALMELGSAICTPRIPKCSICPVVPLCPTHAAGLQDRIPAEKNKTQYEDRCEVAVVVRRKHHVLIRQCQPGERWAGLWDFPRYTEQYPVADKNAASRKSPYGRSKIVSDIPRRVHELTGVQVSALEYLTTMKHAVTRYRITLHCYVANVVADIQRAPSQRRPNGGTTSSVAPLAWVKCDELDRYPLSVTGRKIAHLISR